MTLPAPPDRWAIDLANAQRVEAIAAFGFTERQARFLLNVLLHAGVFVERQYLLGQASILTTERYDNQRLEALQAAVERLEGGRPKGADKVSRIFQDPTEQSVAEREDPPRNPPQVTDSLRDGELVPVRGYAKGGDAGNIAFISTAA